MWLIRPRAGEDRLENPGLATIVAKLELGDATAFHAAVTEIAALLEEHATPQGDDEPLTAGHWRSQALALLADPAAALAFLHRCDHPAPTPEPAPEPEPAEPTEPAESRAPSPLQQPARTRGTARIFVHLALGLDGQLAPVSRVEGVGPVLAAQLADLLRHHHITVTPVIDLHEGRSVNGYEHPTDVKERVTLRTAGTVFPHATDLTNRSGRPPDLDHVTPYEPPRTGGPPGQTGDHNAAPLQRLVHRAVTHLGYQRHQTGPSSWIWRTPHGLHRLVDGAGTHRLTAEEYEALRRAS